MSSYLQKSAFVNCFTSLALLALLGGASVAQAQTTPFSCGVGKSYLFAGAITDAYRFNIATGKLTQATTNGIVKNTNQQLNAFGYNQVDNLIYGQRNGTSQLVRLDSTFTATILDVSGLTNTGDDIMNTVVGDIDASGVMYITRGGSPGGKATTNNIYKIDLNQSSLQAVVLPVSPPATYINDWAFSPKDGNLYAIYSYIGGSSGSTQKLTLYRYTTTGSAAGTQTVLGEVTPGQPVFSNVTDQPITASNFNSAFMDAGGNLYVGNSNGFVYRISSPDKGNLVANYVTTTSIAGQTNVDGARCPTTSLANSGPLPVQLTAFAATAAPNRAVRLDWTTGSELNNSYFEVQRSADGRTFAAVGRVAGHGTTMQASTYSFTDATPGDGATQYYRLRQVDQDGNFEFSPVRVVALAAGSSAVLLSVAPNPTAAADLRVQVQYGGTVATPAQLTVRNLLGESVLREDVMLAPGTNILAPGTAALRPGVYLVGVSGPAAPASKSMRVLVTN